MKITKQYIRKLIKEEVGKSINEGAQAGLPVRGNLRSPNIFNAIEVMLAYAEGKQIPAGQEATVALVVDNILQILGREKEATHYQRLFPQK